MAAPHFDKSRPAGAEFRSSGPAEEKLSMNTEFRSLERRRWLFLLLGTVLLLCLGLIYAWSVFRTPLEQEFGWSKAQTSVTFSISMMMFCLGGLASGSLAGKRGPRLPLLLCAAFLLAGFVSASRIQTLGGIYATYGGLCGFGVGLGYNAVISTVVRWFPDKQGLVSGIALMGFGFGGMVLGTVGAGMITALGWRRTFAIFGFLFAAVMAAGALGLRPPEERVLAVLSTERKTLCPSLEEADWRTMLRRRNFWLYFLWAVTLSAAGLAVINSSAVYARSILQGDLTQAAAAAGLVSVANGAGRVLFGQLFDAKGYRVTMLTDCGLYLLAAAVLILSDRTGSASVLIAAFLLIGLAYGGVTPTNSAFIARFFGRKHYALNFSLINLNLMIASYLGPMCGNGSYLQTFFAVAAFGGAGLVITLLIHRPETKEGEQT